MRLGTTTMQLRTTHDDGECWTNAPLAPNKCLPGHLSRGVCPDTDGALWTQKPGLVDHSVMVPNNNWPMYLIWVGC